MLQKAKVKETGEIIYVRPPYEGEYISSLYEPDYVRIDENYKVVFYKDRNGIKQVYDYEADELELIYDL